MAVASTRQSPLPLPDVSKGSWPWTVTPEFLPESMPDGSAWPRVTIVTPSYNQGDYIEETIRSVLLQGYPNLEYFVVDGGSSDNTLSIIEKYADHLSDWVSEPDRGQSHAINKGWARGTGEIYAWLNSDDVYAPGAIAEAVIALMADPTAAAVFSNCQYIDSEGRTIVQRRPGQIDFSRLLHDLVSRIPQPTCFVRGSVLTEVGVLDETAHYSMDYDLWLRISIKHRMVYHDRLWASTRMHADAKTVASQRRVWETKISVIERALESPSLPPELREEVPSLYGAYYWKVGCVCLVHGDLGSAVHHFRRSILLRPSGVLKWSNWQRLKAALAKRFKQGRGARYWPTAD